MINFIFNNLTHLSKNRQWSPTELKENLTYFNIWNSDTLDNGQYERRKMIKFIERHPSGLNWLLILLKTLNVWMWWRNKSTSQGAWCDSPKRMVETLVLLLLHSVVEQNSLPGEHPKVLMRKTRWRWGTPYGNEKYGKKHWFENPLDSSAILSHIAE